MSKAQAITFPFALLLLDYWPLERLGEDCCCTGGKFRRGSPFTITSSPHSRRGSLLLEKLPWLALSAASAVITMRTGGAAFTHLALNDATESKFPLWVRLGECRMISYVQYLGRLFGPRIWLFCIRTLDTRSAFRAAVLVGLTSHRDHVRSFDWLASASFFRGMVLVSGDHWCR
jgi:hypothetical protein